jgi:hypothetical protein
MTQTPPESAVILFDGTDLSNWTSLNGSDPGWQVEGDAMRVVPRSGDVISKETFMDNFVHVEFRCPDMPEATGQAKGNSGVFLQGRYEIQVLDSYGIEAPGMGDCGAIYNQFAPLVNACKPPLEWQTYDVIFRAPRFNDAGETVEGPRITVIQNGLVIINNAQMAGSTGGSIDSEAATPGPLRLQDHGNDVRYRNIWAVSLPFEGSDQY